MKAREYFGQVAENYSHTITSGFVGGLKNREKDYVMRLLSPRKGDWILDAGCGSGFYAHLVDKAGARVFCVDISPPMVQIVTSSGIQAEVHNIESFDLDRKFNKILAAGPLEFCENPFKAMQNLRKHISDNGSLVCTVPRISLAGAAYWCYHLSHGLAIKLFSLKGIISILDRAGFEVETVLKPIPFLFIIRAIPRPGAHNAS